MLAGDIECQLSSSTICKIHKAGGYRANLAGITNIDVANSATSAMSGTTVTTLQDGDLNIPVVARLKMNERTDIRT